MEKSVPNTNRENPEDTETSAKIREWLLMLIPVALILYFVVYLTDFYWLGRFVLIY